MTASTFPSSTTSQALKSWSQKSLMVMLKFGVGRSLVLA